MVIPDAVHTLAGDLREVFGARLRSLVVYTAQAGDEGTPTLVVVDGLTADDLRACASRIVSWHGAGLATPLVLGTQEFGRSLDAFPFEFGAIMARHALVTGVDPFAGLTVDPAHLRHACEIQVRSHLLHLREGYLETAGRSDGVADLIRRSATPLAALLGSVARLHGDHGVDPEAAARVVERGVGLPADSLAAVAKLATGGTVTSEDARRIFPAHLTAVERLTQYVDQWGAGARS